MDTPTGGDRDLPATLETVKRPRELIAPVAILVLGLVLVAVRFAETPVGSLTDDAYYVELARSLAEGKGPVLDLGPSAPPASPGIFPPGFPMMLAPAAFLFPYSLPALKFLPLLATLALLPVCLLLPDSSAPRVQRLALGALVLVNPWVVAWAGRILSDNPFCLFSVGALVAYGRWRQRMGVARLMALVICAGLAVTLRTIGLALVAAVTTHLLLTGHWRRVPAFWAGVALVMLPAVLLELSAGGEILTSAYRQQILGHSPGVAGRLAFAWSNLTGYVSELPVAILPLFGNPVAGLAGKLGLARAYPAIQGTVGILLAVAVLAGLWKGWRSGSVSRREQARFLGLYLLFYGGALLNFDGYPSGVQTRLLIPLVPVVYLLLLEAARWLPRPTEGRVMVLGTVLILAMSLVHNGWRMANPLRSATEASGRGLVDPGQGSAWIRDNTRPDDLILVEDPLERHIHFARPVAGFETVEILEGNRRAERISPGPGATYVFIGPHIHHLPRQLGPRGEEMLARVGMRPERFTPVFRDTAESIYVFRRERR
jgi:hypothetical protein